MRLRHYPFKKLSFLAQESCGYVTQKCDLLPGLSVYQTLRYAADLTIGRKVSQRHAANLPIGRTARLKYTAIHQTSVGRKVCHGHAADLPIGRTAAANVLQCTRPPISRKVSHRHQICQLAELQASNIQPYIRHPIGRKVSHRHAADLPIDRTESLKYTSINNTSHW